MKRKSIFLCTFFLAVTGCGSSSESEIQFAGTLSAPGGSPLAQSAAEPLPGVEVCALGQCSFTDEIGRWSFIVGDDDYVGGDVLFSFQGNSLLASTLVPNLLPDTDTVLLDFLAISGDSVVLSSVDEIDNETIEDEVDELGEDIEDEADSAGDSIGEELGEL